MSITYGDVLDPQLLDQFHEYKDKIAELKFDDNNFAIDVDKIIKCLGLDEVDTIVFDKSGQYDSNEHKIVVNILDSPQRQRFTKAHEIGHAVLGHKGKNGVSSRDTSNINYDRAEIEANKFAADLLMPKKLIRMAIAKYQKEKNISDPNKINIDNLIRFLARQLNVSVISMKYRLINLKIIIPGESDD